jgi:putative transposase
LDEGHGKAIEKALTNGKPAVSQRNRRTMKSDPKLHHRRSLRLPGYDYTRAGAYSITIVTHGREELFGAVVDYEMVLNKFGQVALSQWERLPRRFRNIELGEFVIMPNHVHRIIMIMDGRGTAEAGKNIVSEVSRCAPTEQFGKPVAGSIPTIVRSYKSAVSLRVNLMLGTKGLPVWQRNYYEHIIRDNADYLAQSNYIIDNPMNWEKDNENQ